MNAKTIDQITKARGDISNAEIAAARSSAEALLPLAALRIRAGLTQGDIAARLGKSQAAISKFESRGDFLLSTLYRHIKAVGGDLCIEIRTKQDRFQLHPTEYGDDVGFSLSACRETAPHAELVSHARHFNALRVRKTRSNQRWLCNSHKNTTNEVNRLLAAEEA